MAGPSQPINDVQCRVYVVPTDRPEADGTIVWSETTVVHVTIGAGRVVGTGWTYASGGAQQVINETLRQEVVGSDPMDVPGVHEAMVRACRNLGRPGVVSSAVSAMDIALWDLKARLLDISLVTLLGRCRSDIPLYGSGGFTTYDDGSTANQVERWLSQGMAAVKIKIGESWGSEVGRDRARTQLVRRILGSDIELFVDANGGYRRKQAVRVGRQLYDECGVTWFEEPVSSDDLEGLREVRDLVPMDVTAGEYGYDESYFARMVVAGAVDCLQIDVTRCGGFTSWLRAAATAGAQGLDVSAHCSPALHAQVAGSVPNLRHVEYFHDHERIEKLLFSGVPEVTNGHLVPDNNSIGHGYNLKAADAESYRTA